MLLRFQVILLMSLQVVVVWVLLLELRIEFDCRQFQRVEEINLMRIAPNLTTANRRKETHTTQGTTIVKKTAENCLKALYSKGFQDLGVVHS